MIHPVPAAVCRFAAAAAVLGRVPAAQTIELVGFDGSEAQPVLKPNSWLKVGCAPPCLRYGQPARTDCIAPRAATCPASCCSRLAHARNCPVTRSCWVRLTLLSARGSRRRLRCACSWVACTWCHIWRMGRCVGQASKTAQCFATPACSVLHPRLARRTGWRGVHRPRHLLSLWRGDVAARSGRGGHER